MYPIKNHHKGIKTFERLALKEILAGNITEENYAVNDDWTIEKRCHDALNFWQLPALSISQKMETLSGGEKMRLMLCCLTISHQSPDLIILDEPTNNLDLQNIEILTAAISEYQGTLIVVSHDTYFLDKIKIDQSIQL